MWRPDSLEKTLMLGKIEGGRKRGWQMMRWLDGITNLMDMSLSKLQEVWVRQGSLACCSPWGLKELDATERLNYSGLSGSSVTIWAEERLEKIESMGETQPSIASGATWEAQGGIWSTGNKDQPHLTASKETGPQSNNCKDWIWSTTWMYLEAQHHPENLILVFH